MSIHLFDLDEFILNIIFTTYLIGSDIRYLDSAVCNRICRPIFLRTIQKASCIKQYGIIRSHINLKSIFGKKLNVDEFEFSNPSFSDSIEKTPCWIQNNWFPENLISLKCLDWSGSKQMLTLFVNVISERCKNIKYLSISPLEDHHLKTLSENLNDIISIDFSNSLITKEGYLYFAKYQLSEINLSNCNLNDESFIKLMNHPGRTIRRLYLQNNKILTDFCLYYVYSRVLEVINISHCFSTIIANGLNFLLSRSSNLVKINISYVGKKSYKLTDYQLIEISNCKKLKHISMASCDVTDITLINISESCFSLEYFDIQDCNKITENGIEKIIICCKDLKYLNISNCGLNSTSIDKIQKFITIFCSKMKTFIFNRDADVISNNNNILVNNNNNNNNNNNDDDADNNNYIDNNDYDILPIFNLIVVITFIYMIAYMFYTVMIAFPAFCQHELTKDPKLTNYNQ